MHRRGLGLAVVLAASGVVPALAAEESYELVISDHRFAPAELKVPAGERVKLMVDNQDATPEEFESHDLRREKIIPGNSKGSIWVGPLPKGEYSFYGEFHQDTAQGRLIAE